MVSLTFIGVNIFIRAAFLYAVELLGRGFEPEFVKEVFSRLKYSSGLIVRSANGFGKCSGEVFGARGVRHISVWADNF